MRSSLDGFAAGVAMRALVKIALIQIDQVVGDMAGNADRILTRLTEAASAGAAVALLPELCLPGYPPLDLLERRTFIDDCATQEARIVAEMPEGLVAIFGTVRRIEEGTTLINAAVVAERGAVLRVVPKTLLPTYDVFDEARYFEPNRDPSVGVVEIAGTKIGVTICEDLWNDKQLWPRRRYEADPVELIVAAGADVIVNLSSSPWSQGKDEQRRRLVAHAAKRHGVWVLLANQVGGNDGLIFDGNSLACAPSGMHCAQAAAWRDDLVLVDLDARPTPVLLQPKESIAAIDEALVLGLRDYFDKLGLPRAVIALSGGIDSAVTCYLAVRALGAERVVGISLPSRYSSAGSVDDAVALADNLGITLHTVAIEPMFDAFLTSMKPALGDGARGFTEENLQARIRGTAVMALANNIGGVVLTTGNKSESAVGYCTLYGDTNGGLAPLADLYKHQVYDLARYANTDGVVIPISTIDKPPSAELRPDQKDADSLPEYDVLDEILRLFIEERAPIETIAESAGVEVAVVEDMVRKIYLNEFKRKQLPPTLRVSAKAWVGRVYPIAQRFRR